MNRYARFHNYFNAENPDPGKDRIFWNDTIMQMDDIEFDQFLGELRDLLIRYSFETAPQRKSRDITIISAPVEKE